MLPHHYGKRTSARPVCIRNARPDRKPHIVGFERDTKPDDPAIAITRARGITKC